MADRLDDQGIATVFGGSGFVGRYAVAALAKQGWRVRAAVRRPELAGFLQPAGFVGQVAPVQANLRFPPSVQRALLGSKAVVNAVGVLVSGGRQTFRAIHVEGPQAVAKAAREAGVRHLVHISAIGANAKSVVPLCPLQGRGRGGGTAGIPRRHHRAPLDRLRTRGRVLQSLRRHGARLAAAAADRPRSHALPAGVRRRPRRGHRRLRVRHRQARNDLRGGRPGGAVVPRTARPDAAMVRTARAAICRCRSGWPSCRRSSPGRCPTHAARSRSIRCACCSTTTSSARQPRAKGARWRSSALPPPHGVAAIVPTYLERFRPRGQFAHYRA